MPTTASDRLTCTPGNERRHKLSCRFIRSRGKSTWRIWKSNEPTFGSSFIQKRARHQRKSDATNQTREMIHHPTNPREISRFLGLTRRDFLRDAVGAAVGSTLVSRSWARATGPKLRKAIVVTFGGGARDQETFVLEGQENIPHL